MINSQLYKYLDIFVVAYLDNILVYSKNKEEHVEHIKKVLEKLKQANLLLKPEKCEFYQKEVKFLGFLIGQSGVQMDLAKVEAVLTWPEPTTVKELQSFLGFANFYRRFIKRYSKVAQLLTELTKKDQAYKWTPEAGEAFITLKKCFTTALVLSIFDPTKKIILETDTSDFAIRACLSQEYKPERLKPMAYYSQKLLPAELNYNVHDKELLAIVVAFEQWRIYLERPEHTVQVWTDYKNLTTFTTTKILNRRQVR